MKTRWGFRFVAASIALLSFVALPGRTHAQDASAISSRTAEVGGVTLHYLTAGHGPALILLHGYTQTSRMWRAIIPQLAEKFTVIAPDLPGIGDSSIPKDGLDMKTAAIRIHALAKSLHVGNIFCLMHVGNMPKEKCMYSTKLFAEKVLPKLRNMFPDYADDNRFWCKPIAKQVSAGRLPSDREAAEAVARVVA